MLLLLVGSLCSSDLIHAQQTRRAGGQARIFYDEHMIPHVFGQTDEAAFYGLGYHHMVDFPIATLNALWLHSGRMAEVAGESYLDEDRLNRLWEVPEIADRHEADLAAKGLLPLVQAYVQGIEAGRAWWRQQKAPATSARLDALLGEAFEVKVDRAPDFLNPAFSPYGLFNDPDVPIQSRNTINRMFAASHPITVDHVMRYGVAVNSYFLLRNNEVPREAFAGGQEAEFPDTPDIFIPDANDEGIASNGWMISAPATQRRFVLTHSDGHITLNNIKLRAYMVQLWGRRYKATGLTVPGYPGLYAGYNNHVSWLITGSAGAVIQRNKWEVTLESSPNPEDLKFQFSTGGGLTLVNLELEQEMLDYFDTTTGQMEQFLDARYYVPVQPSEPLALGFTRYPVTSAGLAVPQPEDDIVFEQGSFTTGGSPWEYMIRFGRARNATTDVDGILDNALLTAGFGLNLMVADRDGNFRYLLMGRVPIQGPDVPVSEYNKNALLDGSELGWRWQGYHTIDELPSIGPVDVSGTSEVWINNNATPDNVEESRFTEGDLTAFPEYMVPHESITSWRQERAKALLRTGLTIGKPYNQAVATDKTYAWMTKMWPFYMASRDVGLIEVPLDVSVDAQTLIDWVNQHRHLDELDQPNANYDFVAHVYSQVLVYASLLHSHYLDRLNFLHQEDLMGGGPGLTEEQLSFGDDPRHRLFSEPGSFTYADFGPNIDSMLHALDTVAALWVEGTGDQGLRNQELLAALSPIIPGDPWGDPRFDTNIAPQWQGVIAGEKVTRWGHVNMIGVTPHYLLPPKRWVVEAASDPLDLIRGYFWSALDPPSLEFTSFAFMKIPYFQQSPVVVRPMPGVRHSLFFAVHSLVFQASPPIGYQESVYPWDLDDELYYHPMSSGSQTVFSVELAESNEATPRPVGAGRFLQAIGGTEITQVDLFGDGTLAYQDRFGSYDDFVAGSWNDLIVAPHLLGSPTWKLTYLPITKRTVILPVGTTD